VSENRVRKKKKDEKNLANIRRENGEEGGEKDIGECKNMIQR
jgi:hypothetical protein